jgi:schlafen family protein
MFSKPLAAVTYEDVLAFCGAFAEGVRVEYKSTPVNIPKVVSSFANTVGGIWVIGVDTDAANRAVLPPVGFKATGIEEQIVQSAQTGVYPGITPDVRVHDIPEKPGYKIAVVKVLESVEAPHAIENSTRVYVRAASTTTPIELADLDRIDYLLQRRRAPEQRREELVERAARRSPLSPMSSGTDHRRMRVIVAPVFPRGMLFSYDTLYEVAKRLDEKGDRMLRNFRMVHEGVIGGRLADPQTDHHLEVSTHGVLFFEQPVEHSGTGSDKRTQFVFLKDLLWPILRGVDVALQFFNGLLTNLLIRCELHGCEGVAYLSAAPSKLMRPDDEIAHRQCADRVIRVSTHVPADTLVSQRTDIFTDVLRQMLWTFSYRPKGDFRETVERLLKGLGAGAS